MESFSREIAKDLQGLDEVLQKPIEITNPMKDFIEHCFRIGGGIIVLFSLAAQKFG